MTMSVVVDTSMTLMTRMSIGRLRYKLTFAQTQCRLSMLVVCTCITCKCEVAIKSGSTVVILLQGNET